MNNKEIVAWVAFGMVAGACAVALAWHQTLTSAPTIKAEPPTATIAQPVASPPRCTHEACGERPRWLKCTEFLGGDVCRTQEIQYEHHCVCDAWAP